jgi:hypothetical protein
MSASVRESDSGSSKDESLKYAPKKARQAEPDSAPAAAPPTGGAAPQRTAPEPAPQQQPQPAEPPWRRSRNRASSAGSSSSPAGAAFAGDVAIAELRTKLALAPDRLPEPPPPSSGGSKLVWAGRITGIAVVVAVGFIGYRWGSSPGSRFQLPHPANHTRPQVGPDRAAADSSSGVPVINAMPAVYPPPSKAAPSPTGARAFRPLMVGAGPVQQADDVARLAISTDAGPNATVLIGGLAAGATLSAGRPVAPNGWRLAVEELPGVFVTPPRGFVGVMDLTLELRLADTSVADRKSLQLEWQGRGAVAAKPQPRQHDAAEIDQMVKKGAELMANGDVAAARLMYQRAAEAGEAGAAFALAETYDPLVLAKGGIAPDVGMAQTWYVKARDLGSTQASERLERLARSPAQ